MVVTVWECYCVRVLLCGSVTMWECYCVGVLLCGSVTLWECYRVGVTLWQVPVTLVTGTRYLNDRRTLLK